MYFYGLDPAPGAIDQTEVMAASPGAVTAAAAGNSGGTDPEYPAAGGRSGTPRS